MSCELFDGCTCFSQVLAFHVLVYRFANSDDEAQFCTFRQFCLEVTAFLIRRPTIGVEGTLRGRSFAAGVYFQVNLLNALNVNLMVVGNRVGNCDLSGFGAETIESIVY